MKSRNKSQTNNYNSGGLTRDLIRKEKYHPFVNVHEKRALILFLIREPMLKTFTWARYWWVEYVEW